jgi:hypothetical protein
MKHGEHTSGGGTETTCFGQIKTQQEQKNCQEACQAVCFDRMINHISHLSGPGLTKADSCRHVIPIFH